MKARAASNKVWKLVKLSKRKVNVMKSKNERHKGETMQFLLWFADNGESERYACWLRVAWLLNGG